MYTTKNGVNKKSGLKFCFFTALLLIFSFQASSQGGILKWSADDNSYFRIENDEVVQFSLPDNQSKVIISKQQLTPPGSTLPLKLSFYTFSPDKQKALLFTNTTKVWRLKTKGDYWILDLKSGSLNQLGKSLPSSSLMFAKFSPDGKSVAYVSGNNFIWKILQHRK